VVAEATLPGPAAWLRRRVCVWDLVAVLVPAGLMALAWALKVALYPGAAQDEAEWLLKTQSFQWGYDLENPPLIMWLGLLWQRLFGTGLAQLLALKFLLMTATYGLLYLAARRALGAAPPALAIAAAPMAVYYVAWVPLNSYTHSVLLLFAIGATLAATVELIRTPGAWSGAALALAAACGVLAKYNYVLFLVGVLAALALSGPGRRALATPWSLGALALAGTLAAPHLLWLARRLDAVEQAAADNLKAAPESLWAHLAALPTLAESLLLFSLPLSVLLAVWFARPVLSGPAWHRPPVVPAAAQLPARQLAVTLMACIGLALAVGATRWRIHYLYPLLPFAWPVVQIAWTRCVRPRWLLGFAGACAALQLTAIVSLVGHAWTQGTDCSRCGQHADFGAVAAELRAAGYQGGGTIVSLSNARLEPGENLRGAFPHARVLSAKWPLTRPAERRPGACLLVWPAADVQALNAGVEGHRPAPFAAPLPAPDAQGRVRAPLTHTAGPGPRIGWALWRGAETACDGR
jgi:hypothetical protein